MGVQTSITGVTNYVLQEAIGMYADEAYTTAKKLTGTGIVGSNPNIDTKTETFIGQLRWEKPLTPVINIASLTTSTNGSTMTTSQDYLTYVKTVRTAGAEKVNMKEVVTQVDGLAKFGRDFAETRAQDEHNALLAVLRGVALTEVLYGCGAGGDGTAAVGLGGQTFTNDPTSKRYGFFVDLASAAPVVASSSTAQGAQRAENFLKAVAMAWKDYEPEYAYLITSPEVMMSLRSANLVDQDTVTEGNVNFNTIFGGKFRLIQTRASQGFSTAEIAVLTAGAGADLTGVKTSFIVLPGALAFEPLTVPEPVEIQRNAAAYLGGGTTSIWHRWGYVIAPAGYNWRGDTNSFASDADYQKLIDVDGGFHGITDTLVANANLTNNATPASATAWVKGTWERKVTSVLSLGILPVFHA